MSKPSPMPNGEDIEKRITDFNIDTYDNLLCTKLIPCDAEQGSDNGYSQEKHDTINEDFEHNHSTLRAILLLIALSLHSVFEGLAVGLQRKTSQIIGVFARQPSTNEYHSSLVHVVTSRKKSHKEMYHKQSLAKALGLKRISWNPTNL
jgi:hypothetical protein